MKRANNGDIIETGCFNGVIHYTGSTKNMTRIGDTCIDWGNKIPYREGAKTLKGIKRILLTHEHLDHVNPSAINKFLQTYPFVKLYAPQSTIKKHFSEATDVVKKRIIAIKHGDKIDIGNNTCVHVVRGSHSVPVVGFVFENNEFDEILVYSTDNYNYQPIERLLIELDKKVVAMLMEGNYDENILLKAIEQTERQLAKAKLPYKKRMQINAQRARLDGSSAHSSVQMVKKFYRRNRTSRKETQLYIMHASDSMFDM